MLNYTEFVESGLGLQLDHTLVSTFSKLTSSDLQDFASAYLALSREQHQFAEARTSVLYRPLIDENLLRQRPNNEEPYFAFRGEFVNEAAIGKMADMLYSICAFSDGAVILDSLPHLLTPYYPNSYETPRSRDRLLVYLKWLSAIRPLTMDGTVQFYSLGRALKTRQDTNTPRTSDLLPRFPNPSASALSQQEPDAVEAFRIRNYLDHLHEFEATADELATHFFFDEEYAAKAYGLYLTDQQTAVRRDILEESRNMVRFLKLEFPIYSESLSADFLDIVRDCEAAHALKHFLTESINNINNLNEIPTQSVVDDIAQQAKEKIQRVEDFLAPKNIVRSPSRVFKFLKPVGTTMAGSLLSEPSLIYRSATEVSEGSLTYFRLKKEIKTLGFIQDIADRY